MRRTISVILVALGCVAMPLALVAVWAVDELGNTDRYVAAMVPPADDEVVRSAVAERVTAAVTRSLRKLDVPVSDVGGLVREAVETAVADDGFPAVWEHANRVAHRRLSAILSGEGGRAPDLEGEGVGLDLTPVYEAARRELVETGLVVAMRLPDPHPTIELLSPEEVARARTVYPALARTRRALPVLSVILLVAGVLAARDRTAALIGAGLGVAAGAAVPTLGLVAARDLYPSGLGARGIRPDAAVVIFDALTDFLRTGFRVLFVAGLILAGAAFLIRRGRSRAGPAGAGG